MSREAVNLQWFQEQIDKARSGDLECVKKIRGICIESIGRAPDNDLFSIADLLIGMLDKHIKGHIQ